MVLTDKDKDLLLTIAREAIVRRLGGASDEVPPFEVPAVLEARCGAFVTLHMNGQLRGCIGQFVSNKPLFLTIADMARSAAFQDPRFHPVTRDEELHIEISVLTPLKKIKDVEEIEVGMHGIYMVKGSDRGVLLPQVATENGFDRLTFLDQTCMKAGIAPGCWREPDTEIYTFEAEIFSEPK